VGKIEAYKAAFRVAQNIQSNLTKARGLDRSDNDKHHIEVSFTGKLDPDNWGDATLRLHASYGYYGSSSGYRAMDTETAKYFVRAINECIGLIADTAIELAKNDAEKYRLDAMEEARMIIGELEQ
jgi:hypothetical protein